MKRVSVFLGVLVLLMASLGCSRGSNNGISGSGSTGYNTKFPLPESVTNFTDTGDGSINFQTKMSLKDTIDWYRTAFAKQGLRERSGNTAITATTFNIVFDGDPSGQAVVIQGVDLGNGLTNVNIRYEKL